jgi:hypothetical protein
MNGITFPAWQGRHYVTLAELLVRLGSFGLGPSRCQRDGLEPLRPPSGGAVTEEREDPWILGLRGTPVVAVHQASDSPQRVVTLADGAELTLNGPANLTYGPTAAPGAVPLPAEEGFLPRTPHTAPEHLAQDRPVADEKPGVEVLHEIRASA